MQQQFVVGRILRKTCAAFYFRAVWGIFLEIKGNKHPIAELPVICGRFVVVVLQSVTFFFVVVLCVIKNA